MSKKPLEHSRRSGAYVIRSAESRPAPAADRKSAPKPTGITSPKNGDLVVDAFLRRRDTKG